MGIFEYKGKEYTIEGETIFTEEEYAQIQRDLSERSKEGKYDYLFYRKVRNKNGEMAKVKCTVKKNAVYLYHYDIQTKKRINEKDIKDQVVSYLKSSNLLSKQKRNRTHNADEMCIRDSSKILNPVFTEDGKGIRVKVFVQYIDKETKALQISQYDMTLQKDRDVYKRQRL